MKWANELSVGFRKTESILIIKLIVVYLDVQLRRLGITICLN